MKEALKSRKKAKNDALLNIQSDYLINGPEILKVHLTNIIRAYVTHGNVHFFLLVCTLLPIVKDNLSDITNSLLLKLPILEDYAP